MQPERDFKNTSIFIGEKVIFKGKKHCLHLNLKYYIFSDQQRATSD